MRSLFIARRLILKLSELLVVMLFLHCSTINIEVIGASGGDVISSLLDD